MSYSVEYISCKICGNDSPKFLGFRGNLEYVEAPKLAATQEHMVTTVVKCRSCGFIYTNPKIILPSEKRSNVYSEPEKYNSSICQDSLKLFNNTINLLEKFTKHRGKLLDVGSGKGEFLATAKMRGWEVFGVDPSQNFVHYAKEKYDLDIQNCILQKANFSENYFDAITLNMVLEHIDNPHGLLSTIYRILKKNGLLYIEVPNMDSMLLKLIKIYFRLTKRDWSPHISPLHHPFHCYGYNRSSLKLLCKMNSFTIRKFSIFGIGLRGFQPYSNINLFKERLRKILAKFFGLIKQGDILIAVATKK